MARVEWVVRDSAHLVVDGDVLTLCGQMRGEAAPVTSVQVVDQHTLICPACVDVMDQLIRKAAEIGRLILSAAEAVLHG